MDFNLLLRARPFVATHLKKDFAAFCRAAWPHLHPGSKLSWTPAHDLICEHLIAVYRGDTRRLIINCPPRFSKSTIVNVCFPVWVWLQDPKKSFLCCSYEIDLALNMNLDRRRLMDSRWFRDLFGDLLTLSTDRSQAGDFGNTVGGQMQAASVNSKAQGRGGDLIIVDDPLSADFAYSESFRNEVNSWFTNQLPQRLNHPSESAIVVIAQRLHQNDPCGFLLSQEDTEWKLLKLPLICEEDETIEFPLSGRVWKRKKGDCLDSKRWSPRTVKERQRNRLVWAGQFQQEPVSVEGNLIHTDEIQFYGGKDPATGSPDGTLPERFDRRIISVDCSFKDTSGSDFVALIVVGILGARRYVIHVTNARLDLTGTENEIRNAHAAYGPISATLVESTANGVAIISRLKEQIPGVIAIDPQGGKMSRMQAAAGEFTARNWYIERSGPWSHRVVEQLTMFPVAKNDDISDAISQASVWLQANTYEYGWLTWIKELATGKRPMPPSVSEIAAKPAPPSQPVQASSRPKEEVLPLCPFCKKLNIRLKPFGSSPPADRICPQCSATFTRAGELVSKPEQSDRCPNFPGPHDWRLVSGSRRCIHCGEQRLANEPRNGMTFRQFEERRRSPYGRFGSN